MDCQNAGCATAACNHSGPSMDTDTISIMNALKMLRQLRHRLNPLRIRRESREHNDRLYCNVSLEQVDTAVHKKHRSRHMRDISVRSNTDIGRWARAAMHLRVPHQVERDSTHAFGPTCRKPKKYLREPQRVRVERSVRRVMPAVARRNHVAIDQQPVFVTI
jgi:hypothetical protein